MQIAARSNLSIFRKDNNKILEVKGLQVGSTEIGIHGDQVPRYVPSMPSRQSWNVTGFTPRVELQDIV